MLLNFFQENSSFANIQTVLFLSERMINCRHISIIVWLVPVTLELPIVKREYHNRWYSPSAYYLALTITDIPFTIISTLIYIMLSYIMTNQPLEELRIFAFLMIGLLTSFTAQGFGLFSGSLFSLKVWWTRLIMRIIANEVFHFQGTLTFAAVFLPLYAIFGGILILVKDTAGFWHYIFDASFVKHGV